MAKKQPQQIPIMQPPPGRGGGGGGASLAQAALGGFINDQNAAQKKMMANFSKMQEAQAMEASQNAAQMTQAMNQVVARDDERLAREESHKEKLGDREYQEKYQEWSFDMQKQATKDFAITQSKVASQLAARRDFVTRMDQNRVESGHRIRAMRDKLNDPASFDYWIDTPGGMDRRKNLERSLRAAENFHENDYQADYTSQAAKEMMGIEAKILAGEPYMDASGLYDVKPKDLMAEAGTPTRTTEDWTDEEIEELWHSGGYPPGGLYGRDPDDPSLEKYKNFNPVNYMAEMELIEADQVFAAVQHKKFQKDWLALQMETQKNRHEARVPLRDFEKKNYDRMAETAVQSVYYGVAGFVDELGSGRLTPQSLSQSLVLKSGEVGDGSYLDNMATKLLESVLLTVGGPGSETKLKKLDNLALGEGDEGLLDVPIELYRGFDLRSMLRHVDDQLMSMTVAPKNGQAMSFQLAKQIFDRPKTPEQMQLIRSLSMVPGDVQRGELLEGIKTNRITGSLSSSVLGQIHRGVDRLFHLAKRKANRYRDIIEAQPVMKTYTMEGSRDAMLRDAIVASYMSDNPNMDPTSEVDRQRALGGATPEQKREAFLSVEGEPTSEFNIEAETLAETILLSPLQAAATLWARNAHRPEFIAAAYSGDFENMPAILEPKTELDLQQNMGISKRNLQKVEAEMRRRRENHRKKHPPPEEEQEGQSQQQQPVQGQEQKQGGFQPPPFMGE